MLCNASLFESPLPSVNLTLHFTFSENCENIKSIRIRLFTEDHYKILVTVTSLLVGAHQVVVFGLWLLRWLNLRTIQQLSLCLDCGILHSPVAWSSETGCPVTKDGWWEVSSFLQRMQIPTPQALCSWTCCITISPWKHLRTVYTIYTLSCTQHKRHWKLIGAYPQNLWRL